MNHTSRASVLFATLLAVFLLIPGEAFAHGALKSATPAAGDTLSVAPGELRLTFTESLELAISRLSLTGPNGPVALAPLALDPDSATVMIGIIEGPLVSGTYTVNWQAVGADGHPVRGEYAFTITPGAQGLTTAAAAATTQTPQAPPTATEEAGSTESSGANALIWIIAAIVLGAIGFTIFRLFTRGRGHEDVGEHV